MNVNLIANKKFKIIKFYLSELFTVTILIDEISIAINRFDQRAQTAINS